MHHPPDSLPSYDQESMQFQMKVLLIDNYDSYTFNVYQYLSLLLSTPPLVIRNNTFGSCNDLVTHILPYIDAIVISPGPGRPENINDFGICAEIYLHPKITIPVLGICLGHQGLALAYNARIVNAPQLVHGQTSYIEHLNTGLFESIKSPFLAVRYHSLIVHEESIPECLIPIAWTTTDHSFPNVLERKLIMGLQHRTLPQFGVQFHPESIGSEFGMTIFRNFCKIAESMVSKKMPCLMTSQLGLWSQLNSLYSVIPSVNRETHLIRIPETAPSLNVHLCILDRWFDPELAFEKVFNHKFTKFPIWLDSACVRGSRCWSYMGALSETGFHFSYSIQNKVLTKTDYMGACSSKILESTTFLDYLGNLMTHQYAINRHNPSSLIHHYSKCLPSAILPPFLGGFAGYIGYDMKCETLNLPVPSSFSTLPDIQLIFMDRVLAFDHVNQQVWLIAVSHQSNDVTSIKQWFHTMSKSLSSISNIDPRTQNPLPKVQIDAIKQFTPDLDRSLYISTVKTAQKLIERGESYEICMTTQFRHQSNGLVDAFDLYKTLRRTNPAPYACYFRLSEMDWIACTSPELFMDITNGHVTMKPIKGTSRRGRTCAEDLELRAQLHASVKDRAENMMIVDLIRNDLNLISTLGSVCVSKLMAIETYETVHQMVSTIKADIHPKISPVQVFKHAFPPGSMTGAPKVRTVQLLESELEYGLARGIYSGCIGFISVCGTTSFNVVIRTVVGQNGREMSVGAGGAVIALSDPNAEWDEAVTKCSSVVSGVQAYLNAIY